jgi:RpiR family carbohydrate utilization transcriptional regulator
MSVSLKTEPVDLSTSGGPLSRIRFVLPDLSDALRTCAEFVLAGPWEARGLSIYEVAERSGVSTHAVSRFAQRLGYRGYREFSQALATELGQIEGAAYAIPEALVGELPSFGESGGSAAGVVARVLAIEQAALQDTLRVLDMDSVDQAVSALARARRVLFVATGAGIGVCELAAYRFKVLGLPAACTPDPATIIPEMHLLEPGDVVIGVSYHGYSRGVVEGLAYARERELTTICITAVAGSPVTQRADIQLLVSNRTEAQILGQFSSRVTTAALLEAVATGVAWLRRDKAVPHAAEVTLAAQRRTSVPPKPKRTRRPSAT